MNYVPKYFELEELLYPKAFADCQARGIDGWQFLDARMLATLDQLHDRFGPFIVNNWHEGGPLQNCGLRPFDADVGAKYSQHHYGRAADCHFKVAAEDVRQYVLAHESEFGFLTCIERNVTWFHFDVRNHSQPGILVVNP